ncbi:hypothetical protein D3C81_1295830 [compost metagenome]
MFLATVMSQQHNRQIRPGRLLFQIQEQRFQFRPAQGFGGDQHQAGTDFDFLAQRTQTWRDDSAVTRLVEDHQRNLAVATHGRQNQRPFGQRHLNRHKRSSCSNGLLAPR